MIRVVIDTNNLPSSVSSPSAAFKRSVKLIQEGVISILMPGVIAEEWRTQQLDHLRKHFQKAADSLKEVLAGGHLEDHREFGALIVAAMAIERTASGLEAISQLALERLLHELQTNVIPIADDHGSRIAAAYFRGSSPFAGIKSRKDFPDAFVYEAVIDLVGHGDRVLMVTADRNLAKHLASVSGVTCVESLEQLVESEQVRDSTAAIALEARWRQELPSVVTSVKGFATDVFGADFVNSFINKLAGREVEHQSIPSDNHDARVSMVHDPEDIEIDWGESEDYGPGVLRVPFSCTSEVLLDFYIFHADAYSQPDIVSVQWGDHEEDSYFDAQATSLANVSGFISVTLNDWPESMNPESIEVTVDEITEVELSEDDVGNALI
jgi:hypothetical protein